MQQSAFLIVLVLVTPFNTEPSSISPALPTPAGPAPLGPALPSPVNVFFSSVNLRNVLHWDAGKGTPSSTHYTVQYAIYGDRVSKGDQSVRWRETEECRDTEETWCDLSGETADLEEGYYARVQALGKPGGQRASSDWTRTPMRFDPKSDTTFGPPLVTVEMRGSTAIVQFHGPMRWRMSNETREVSMASVYPQMTYNLSVRNVQTNHTNSVQVRAERAELRLDYNTELCFSACAGHRALLLPCQPSQERCVWTQQDPATGQSQKIIVGIVVPTICVCMLVVIGWMLYYSVGGKNEKNPEILERFPLQTPPLFFTPENLNIIIINNQLLPLPFTSQSQHAKPQPIPALPEPVEAGPPLSYAPQVAPQPEASWEDEFPGVQVEAVDYGFVGIAPGPEERGGEGGGSVYAPQVNILHHQLTHTPINTHTLSHTPINIHTFSHTPANTHKLSHTPANTHTLSHTPVNTHTLSHTPVNTHTLSHTPFNTHTLSHTPVNTHTLSHTPVNTHTLSHTPVNTHTLSPTSANTHTLSHTPVNTHTLTHTPDGGTEGDRRVGLEMAGERREGLEFIVLSSEEEEESEGEMTFLLDSLQISMDQ